MPMARMPTLSRLVVHHAGDDVADQRGGGEGVAADDDGVAGLGLVQGAEHGQRIGGIGIGGNRRGGEGGAIRIERLDAPVQHAAPLHGVHDVRGLGAGEAGDEGGVGPPPAAMDGERGRVVDHGASSRISRRCWPAPVRPASRRYSTVTLFARLRGWSTSVPFSTATW
jgi:hypothetical protein